jgi:N-acetylglucosamine kinase-like BadF-type ATPase
LFSVDKLPTQYTTVELGVDGGSTTTMAAIDRETGQAVVKLP